MSKFALLFSVGLAIAFGLSCATPRAETSHNRDCFWHLEQSRQPEIACEFPTALTTQERDELRRLTRDLLQDAHCLVAIRIPRQAVEQALAAPDFTFEAPEQPVTCEIKTRDSVISITGHFAPKVEFQNGQAISATPGLRNVTGVSSVLAWPVVQYVNHSQTIRDGMLTVINGYRTHRAAKQARAN